MAKDGVTYIRIPAHLLGLGLRSAHELVLLGLAIGFNGKGIRMSNTELARLFGTDRRNIPRLTGRLVDRGFLHVEIRNGRRIIHPTDVILTPPTDIKVKSPPDINLTTPRHQSNDEVTSDLPYPSTSEGTEREVKSAQSASNPRSPKTAPPKASRVIAIIEHWNSHSGRSVEKLNSDTGQTTTARWHGCRLGEDGAVRADVDMAIQPALKDFNPDDIEAAIDNYAKALLNPESFWTHSWSVAEFFTRKEGRAKEDGFKWWRFLPGTFDFEKYRSRKRTGDEVNLNGSTEEEILAAFGE